MLTSRFFPADAATSVDVARPSGSTLGLVDRDGSAPTDGSGRPALDADHELIAWTAHRLGLGDAAGGVLTSGVAETTHRALELALRHAASRGTTSSMCVLAADSAGAELARAADGLGLGVVHVETDDLGRMSTSSLRHTLTAVELQGCALVAVVASAGTTDRGALDPLPAIAAVCSLRDVWLHVDATVGGALITSHRNRHLIDGAGCADSVAMSYHEGWYRAAGTDALLVRDRHLLTQHERGEEKQNRATSPRLAEADIIGDWLDAALDLAQAAYRVADEFDDIDVLERPMSHLVLFRLAPARAMSVDALDALNDTVADELARERADLVSRTRHAGHSWLKLTLLDPDLTVCDVRAVFDAVCAHARRRPADPGRAATA